MTDNAQYSTTSSWVLSIYEALEAESVDTDELFRQCGLSLAQLKQQEQRIDADITKRLWALSMSATNNDAFGLLVSKYLLNNTLNALGVAFTASATVGQFIDRAIRYYQTVSNALTMSFTTSGNTAIYSVAPSPGGFMVAEGAIDAIMGFAVEKLRELTNPSIEPIRVEFIRPKPKNIKAFEKFFNCPMYFECEENALIYNKDEVDTPLNRANEKLAQIMDQYLSSVLEELEDNSFTRTVYSSLYELLPSGNATLSELAKKLNTSERSVQRKLKEEGVVFKDVLNNLRLDLAKRYLKEGKRNIGEIGAFLGFSTHSNFVRFFKSRTGCSPSDYVDANSNGN